MKFRVVRTATEVLEIDMPTCTELPDDEYNSEERDEFMEAVKNLANHTDAKNWCTVESDLEVEVAS